MNDPRNERILGILRDIPELRDSPLLEPPFSDCMLKKSDRWMVVTRSDSMAVGASFEFFPDLALAAPHVVGNVGNILGMWNLFDGSDYGERRVPLASMDIEMRGAEEEASASGFSCSSGSFPPPAMIAAVDPHPDAESRASRLCWETHGYSFDRFCIIESDRSSDMIPRGARFLPSLRDVSIEMSRNIDRVLSVHDLFSDNWEEGSDVEVRGRIDLDGRAGCFHLSISGEDFDISFDEEMTS